MSFPFPTYPFLFKIVFPCLIYSFLFYPDPEHPLSFFPYPTWSFICFPYLTHLFLFHTYPTYPFFSHTSFPFLSFSSHKKTVTPPYLLLFKYNPLNHKTSHTLKSLFKSNSLTPLDLQKISFLPLPALQLPQLPSLPLPPSICLVVHPCEDYSVCVCTIS